MNRLVKFLLSMPFMLILVFIFLSAIGIATFLESSYGYNDLSVSKYFIYGATWFEWVIFLLFINLINNIFKYKLFRKEKIGSLLFHFSFLIIVIGAFITRHYSYEGMMAIRENSASNYILSSRTYLQIGVNDKIKQTEFDIPLEFSGPLNEAKADLHNTLSKVGMGGLTTDHIPIEAEFNFPDESHLIEVTYHDFLPQYFEKDTFELIDGGEDILHIVTVGENGRKNNYLPQGGVIEDQGVMMTLNNASGMAAINVITTDSGDYVQTPFDLEYFQMRDQSKGIIPRDTLVPFLPMRLYSVGNAQFVYKQKINGAKLTKIGETNHPMGVNTLQVKIKDAEYEKVVSLSGGGAGMFPRYSKFSMNGLNYKVWFGSKIIPLSFFIHLKDFEQERYPGTDNPSSYASEVTLVDTINDVKIDHRIFMNNVLDYAGYRFFQSSFDEDEKGTILSVNHDWWGTNITYLGYTLMALGMFISIFARGSRFKLLLRKSNETRKKRESLTLLLIFGLLTSFSGMAQGEQSDYVPVDPAHAESFGKLIIQDFGGRFTPVHTMADKIIRKVSRSETYNGLNGLQVFIGLHTNFGHWFEEPLIYVSGDSTRRLLGVEGKRASMSDFYDEETGYKLSKYAKAALQKPANSRNVFEKDFIKTDERFNIIRGVVMGYYLKIFPMKGDPNDTWYAPADNLDKLHGNDSTFVSGIMTLYLYEVQHSSETGNWLGADSIVTLIDTYQRGAGNASIMPSESKIEWEIFYNKANIFKWLTHCYILFGLILLIIQFIHLFKPHIKVNRVNKIGVFLFVIFAGFQAFALGLRWYLSGHAPWSNGYEAIVFISFITILAGLLFARQSKIVLGAAGILAWLMLFVAGLNNMDPEISNLVPVLKSYWLMIHVAIITGSYGFLGLAAILGIINLFIEIFKTTESKKRMGMTAKELRYINEMSMTIGIFMLTIGTFLGGVWANESWGRYWGWDAKETWALVSVLVYTMILHFRFIPGLKSDYTFNVASVLGYGSIIMTFYGVNFYLSGLHSYATGEPLPIPMWVPITLLSFLGLFILAFVRKRRAL